MKNLITFLVLLLPINAFSQEVGKLLFFKGNVQIFRSGKIIPASKNLSLRKLDKVTTFKKSLAIIQLKKESKLKINENGQVTLEENREKDTVRLNKGSVFINVLKQALTPSKKVKFELKAQTVSMGVRGTSFYASFGKTQKKNPDIWMCVNTGVVDVLSQNSPKSVAVKAGEGVKVENGKNISDPSFLPWTKNLNWKMDPKNGSLENTVSIENAYTDVLDEDYD